jgi:hypothetical protein
MIITIEFFIGIIVVFLIGYLIAIALEKIFHIHLNNSSKKHG